MNRASKSFAVYVLASVLALVGVALLLAASVAAYASEAEQITYTDDGIPVIPASMAPAQYDDAELASEADSSAEGLFDVTVAASIYEPDLHIRYTDVNGDSREATFFSGAYTVEAVYTYSLVSYSENDGVRVRSIDGGESKGTTLTGDFLKVEISSMVVSGDAEVDGEIDYYSLAIDEFIDPSEEVSNSYVDLTATITEAGRETYTFRKLSKDTLPGATDPVFCIFDEVNGDWVIGTETCSYDANMAQMHIASPASSYLIGLEPYESESDEAEAGTTPYNALLFYSFAGDLPGYTSVDVSKLENTLRTRTQEFGVKRATTNGEEQYPCVERVPLYYFPEQHGYEQGSSKELFKARIHELAETLNAQSDQSKEECVTVVAWSGHGNYLTKNEQSVLCLEEDEEGFVSGAELREILSELPGRVICILNACHSGGLLNTASLLGLDDEAGTAALSDEEYASAYTQAFAEGFLGTGSEASLLADGTADAASGAGGTSRYQLVMATQSVETGLVLGYGISGEVVNNFCLAFGYDGTSFGNNDKSYNTFAADYNRDGKITMSELATCGQYAATTSTPLYYPSYDNQSTVLTCLTSTEDEENLNGASFEVTDYDAVVEMTPGDDGTPGVTVSAEIDNKLGGAIQLNAYWGLCNSNSSGYKNNARWAMQCSFLNTGDEYCCYEVGSVTLAGAGANEVAIRVNFSTDSTTYTLDDVRDRPLYLYLQLDDESHQNGGTQFMVLKLTVADNDGEQLTVADKESMTIKAPSAEQFGQVDADGVPLNPYTVNLSEDDDEPDPLTFTYRFAEDRLGDRYVNRYANCVASMRVYRLEGGVDTEASRKEVLTLFKDRNMYWQRQDKVAATEEGRISNGWGEVSWNMREASGSLVSPGLYVVEFTATYNGDEANPQSSQIYVRVVDGGETPSQKLIRRIMLSDKILSLWYRDGGDGSVRASELADGLMAEVPAESEGRFEVAKASVYGITENGDVGDYASWGEAYSEQDLLKAVAGAGDTKQYLPVKLVLRVTDKYYEQGYVFSDDVSAGLNSVESHPNTFVVEDGETDAGEPGRTITLYWLHPLYYVQDDESAEEGKKLTAYTEDWFKRVRDSVGVYVDAEPLTFGGLADANIYAGSVIGIDEDAGCILRLFTETADGETEIGNVIPEGASEVTFELSIPGTCVSVRQTVPVKPSSGDRGSTDGDGDKGADTGEDAEKGSDAGEGTGEDADVVVPAGPNSASANGGVTAAGQGTGQSSGKGEKLPSTGDASSSLACMGLMAVSAAAMAAGHFLRRDNRRRRRDNRP